MIIQFSNLITDFIKHNISFANSRCVTNLALPIINGSNVVVMKHLNTIFIIGLEKPNDSIVILITFQLIESNALFGIPFS